MNRSTQHHGDTSPKILKTLGVSLWVSFLCAGIATMLFFATFDPLTLAEQATFPLDLSREAGYTIGFFLFWLLLMINSSLVLFLHSTPTHHHTLGR